MVFCYKLITESPRRSASVSPRRKSPVGRAACFPNSMSELISSFDYEAYNTFLDCIPEREWRLLAALAKKKDEDDERERLADQFRKMWQIEKEERVMVEAETSEQYKRYLLEKRRQERSWLDHKRNLRQFEQQIKKGQLMNCIKHKEKRSADLLAWQDDKKGSELVDKAIEEEVKSALAAERRYRLSMAEDWRRQLDLSQAQRRLDEARRRRDALLKDASQRVAISNALSSWECAVARRETLAAEAMQRAGYAAHAACTAARSRRLARQAAEKTATARIAADTAARLRDALRAGHYTIF